MIRVVTYSRVSTAGQETLGQSLENQDRAFETALAAHPDWRRVKHYREAASAKTIAGRAEFSTLLDELDATRPDMIVVDTLDRFTRNLREGLNVLEQLRGRRMKLMPLDWRRDTPIDVDDDRDWQDVVQEFLAAERENRIRSRRMKRSYEGRRERGAVTSNVAPFGLVRSGDRFRPGEWAWVIAELDRRYLAGEPGKDILRWAQSVTPRAWKNLVNLNGALRMQHYVDAGVRSPETAAAIAAMMASRAKHMGAKRVWDHEFTGVFACGRCGGIMGGSMGKNANDAPLRPMIVCQGDVQNVLRPHRRFMIDASRVVDAWNAIIERLVADDALLDAWVRAGVATTALEEKRRTLLRRLAAIDDDTAKLRARRDTAFDLLGDPELAAQARKMLLDVANDETALAVKADAVRAELLKVETTAGARDAGRMRAMLADYRERYAAASNRERNALNVLLVAALGSHPTLDRTADHRWAPVILSWPGVIGAGSRTAPESTSRRRSTTGRV